MPGAPRATPVRLSRAFTVPAGTYEVIVAVKEVGSLEKGPPRTAVLRRALAVPDFWNGELNTSTIILVDRIEKLSAPLTPEQLTERPYAIGTFEVVPAWDTKLSRKEEVSTFLLIYNPKTNPANKPDVVVEYSFFARSGSAEKLLTRTTPLALNAKTLPPQFDAAAGHQLQSGRAVPLSTFPEGDYRLEIRVTDKIANKSISRDLTFTVTP
jgi:hypothetical protein